MGDQNQATQRETEADAIVPPPGIAQPLNTQTTEPATAQQLADVEEKMSSFEKATLRWAKIAVLLSGLAAAFVCAQWYEMHTGATDTHALADAAKTQAEKMKTMSDAADKIKEAAQNMVIQDQRIADNAKTALGASNKQSKAVLDATIVASRLEQRAWVAAMNITMDTPEIGKPISGSVVWNNSGKTFAKRVEPRCHYAFVENEFSTERELMSISNPKTSSPNPSIGVLAPGGQYKTPILGMAPVNEVDKQRITGKWQTYMWGEITYFDIFGKRHQTLFCSHRQGTSAEFVQCAFHNDAD